MTQVDAPMANIDMNANFCFPIPQQLQNARVKLVPFNVRVSQRAGVNTNPPQTAQHAPAFYAAATDDVYTYLPWGPFPTPADFVSTVIEQRIAPDPGIALFAILDRESVTEDGDGALAGTIGLLNTSAPLLSTELGFVITLPRFQRTHVTSNAAGLLLHWLLDTPARGGLGLRRVVWKANALNDGSVRAAERMGFRREALMRWDRVLPAWKTEAMGGNGGGVRAGDPREGCFGGDSVVLGLCWDDWEDGGREKVDAIMQRRGLISLRTVDPQSVIHGFKDLRMRTRGFSRKCPSSTKEIFALALPQIHSHPHPTPANLPPKLILPPSQAATSGLRTYRITQPVPFLYYRPASGPSPASGSARGEKFKEALNIETTTAHDHRNATR
ncbi:acyl-CoA N-acyltransferase [Mycena galericulata]|nr:acyl-CoA N-acyltransferase [Mycena galericulata]